MKQNTSDSVSVVELLRPLLPKLLESRGCIYACCSAGHARADEAREPRSGSGMLRLGGCPAFTYRIGISQLYQ